MSFPQRSMSHLREIHKGSSIAGGICQKSEGTLSLAIEDLKVFCKELIEKHGGTFYWKKVLKGSELFETNKNCSISPDGGLFYMTLESRTYCFLIVEDKCQGTNDTRFVRKLPKQASGNAIERVFKNLNASWHLFKDLPVSPYLVFVSGCDFHSTETIIDRIGPMSNFGKKPLVWEKTSENIFNVDEMKEKINIKKNMNREFATFCVKTHKYNEFPNGSTMWLREERLTIMKHIAEQSIKEIALHHSIYGRICPPTYDNIHR